MGSGVLLWGKGVHRTLLNPTRLDGTQCHSMASAAPFPTTDILGTHRWLRSNCRVFCDTHRPVLLPFTTAAAAAAAATDTCRDGETEDAEHAVAISTTYTCICVYSPPAIGRLRESRRDEDD